MKRAVFTRVVLTQENRDGVFARLLGEEECVFLKWLEGRDALATHEMAARRVAFDPRHGDPDESNELYRGAMVVGKAGKAGKANYIYSCVDVAEL